MAVITIIGTGGSSKYEVIFDGPITDQQDIESFQDSKQGSVAPNSAIGSVSTGEDIWEGPLPATVKNLTSGLGSASDIIAEVSADTRLPTAGERVRLNPGEQVTFGGDSETTEEMELISCEMRSPT